MFDITSVTFTILVAGIAAGAISGSILIAGPVLLLAIVNEFLVVLYSTPQQPKELDTFAADSLDDLEIDE